MRLLVRLGFLRDPLIAWMERMWRLTPHAAGPAVWKGRFAGFTARLWTGDEPVRTYRVALGDVLPRVGARFIRSAHARRTGWSHPDRPPVPVGGGFSLDAVRWRAHRAARRIREYAGLVRTLSPAVDDVSLDAHGVRLDMSADRASRRTLARDIAVAAALLRLERRAGRRTA